MSYKGFPYQPSELSAFAVTCGIFVISLKNGKIIHYTPDNEDSFHDWLVSINVREVVGAC